MRNANEFAAKAGSRSQGYWLLSRLFLEPPSAAFLGEVQDALAAAEGGSPEQQGAIAFLLAAIRDAFQDPDAAAVAFTRHLVLFSRECDAPIPFESRFRQSSSGGASKDLVERISSWGYGTAPAAAAPPDHVGAELRVMAWLCNDEREAWQSGDYAGAMASQHRQRELLCAHLAQWIPDYCRSLDERAGHVYLQAIARLTATSLEAEIEVSKDCASQADMPALA